MDKLATAQQTGFPLSDRRTARPGHSSPKSALSRSTTLPMPSCRNVAPSLSSEHVVGSGNPGPLLLLPSSLTTVVTTT
jgi:hypothetical protein